MTHDQAFLLCTELECMLDEACAGAEVLLKRAHQIESSFFADLEADSYLLTTVARVVDDLEDLLCDDSEPDLAARASLREGPIRDSLERLKSAVTICYDRTLAMRPLRADPRRDHEPEPRQRLVLAADQHP